MYTPRVFFFFPSKRKKKAICSEPFLFSGLDRPERMEKDRCSKILLLRQGEVEIPFLLATKTRRERLEKRKKMNE